MATTVTAIRTALETLLTGSKVVPAGDAFGNSAYVVANVRHTWEDRPEADIDRQFTIGDIPPGEMPWIGSETEALLETSVEVIIGHTQTGESDHDTSRGRRDRDCEQITRALEAPSNFPAGVCVIRRAEDASYESIRDGKFWVTIMRFELTYLGAVSV